MLNETATHLAGSDDADVAAGEIRRAPDVIGTGPHALPDADGSEDAAIAHSAALGGTAGRPAAGLTDDVHVGHGHAEIAGRDVTAAKRLNDTSVGMEELGRLHARIGEDDGLAATMVKPRQGILVGHRAGEAQGIVSRRPARRGVAAVRGDSRAAESRAEDGRMDGDDDPKPARGIMGGDHLLMALES